MKGDARYIYLVITANIMTGNTACQCTDPNGYDPFRALHQAAFTLYAHYAGWLAQAAHGIDEREISTSSESKSISRETTFERDLHARSDRDALSGILTALCDRLADDLKRKGYVSRTISIKLRFDDFQIVSRNVTLPQPIADAGGILQAARECLKRVPLQRRLRLLGVRASTLEPPGADSQARRGVQGDLFA